MRKKIPGLAKEFMLPASRYDESKADFVVQFISALRHTKGEWQGQMFQLLPWQQEIVKTVFGVIGENGFRQCRTCYVEIAKKNGKTMLAAAIALYLLIAAKLTDALGREKHQRYLKGIHHICIP